MALLDRSSDARAMTTAAVSGFWFALLVIVREGFEAAVIVAALLAVVKKRKQLVRARFVHAGWLCAAAVGAVVFVGGRKFLAGAMNERIEGCLAFLAAAMLLHAALWLNARSTTRKTMGELRDRTRGALDRGALALFGIAFLAMFRETFETMVFLEALSMDAPSAVAWGSLAGAVLLCSLVFAVNRLGLRLPMQRLFKVSTVVLVATAVVLLGQGVHSFEEVGILPSRVMPFPQIAFLGIYPDRIGLLAQLAVAAAPLLYTLARLRSASAPAFERELVAAPAEATFSGRFADGGGVGSIPRGGEGMVLGQGVGPLGAPLRARQRAAGVADKPQGALAGHATSRCGSHRCRRRRSVPAPA